MAVRWRAPGWPGWTVRRVRRSPRFRVMTPSSSFAVFAHWSSLSSLSSQSSMSSLPCSERVRGAAHAAPAERLEDVRVDHRRGDFLVAEELLHGSDVVAVLQEVRGEGV